MGELFRLDYLGPDPKKALPPPWRAIAGIACLTIVPFSGSIPLSRYELNPLVYIIPNFIIAIAALLGWRAVRSKTRMEMILGLPVLMVAIGLMVLTAVDRISYFNLF